jgi:hypothetical protein
MLFDSLVGAPNLNLGVKISESCSFAALAQTPLVFYILLSSLE